MMHARLPRPRRHHVPRGFAVRAAWFHVPMRTRRTWTASALGVCVAVLLLHIPMQAPPPPPRVLVPAVTLVPQTPPPAAPAAPQHHVPSKHAAPTRAATPPKPAAAPAVLHAPSTGPVDMTAFALPNGQATTVVGGATAIASTPTAAPSGDPGNGTRARPARPARRDWSCQWPPTAQATDVRDMKVTVVVHTDREGTPQSAHVSSAAAPEFAEAARSCAMHETYRPGLDQQGTSIEADTAAFVVHFTR